MFKQSKESKALLQKVKDFIHIRVQKSQETFDASNIRSLIDLFIEKQKSGNDEVSGMYVHDKEYLLGHVYVLFN